jgi:hypothetical protein
MTRLTWARLAVLWLSIGLLWIGLLTAAAYRTLDRETCDQTCMEGR